MNNKMKIWISGALVLAIQLQSLFAQKIDDDRMKRDIEVAENVLSTLIKQEINPQRSFFNVDVKGNYLPGYGVTFRVPGDFPTPIVFSMGGHNEGFVFRNDGSYTITTDGEQEDGEVSVYRLKEKNKQKRRLDMDSLREQYNLKIIKAAQNFILDYGDFISQLGAQERITVSNQDAQQRHRYFDSGKRNIISVECIKSDLLAFKQGKITRDQALSKIKIVNTETVDVKEPDLELMASIFNRLYRPDLSKTYFIEDNLYYERLKDYGVIYYMQVYSSNESDERRYSMPTLKLENVDQETRNKKVIELYPAFEKEIKENLLEYGRTLKSLKGDEQVVFNIKLTKCKACKIPSSLEVSVKGSVLTDFGAGKLDKQAALGKFMVKKGAEQ
jgi:hypothetical protein